MQFVATLKFLCTQVRYTMIDKTTVKTSRPDVRKGKHDLFLMGEQIYTVPMEINMEVPQKPAN